MIEEILVYNQEFVKNKSYEKFLTSKFPDKKIAIVSCMDTRLTELLPAALGLKNGDVKTIKNAGGAISHPFGSVVRSLLIAVYDLGVEEILVIGHSDCGVQHMDSKRMLEKMRQRGVTDEELNLIRYCGVDFDKWLSGVDCVENSVSETMETIINHPLIPNDIGVYGFIMDSTTGELKEIRPKS